MECKFDNKTVCDAKRNCAYCKQKESAAMTDEEICNKANNLPYCELDEVKILKSIAVCGNIKRVDLRAEFIRVFKQFDTYNALDKGICGFMQIPTLLPC